MGRRVLFMMMGAGALCGFAHAQTGRGAVKGKVSFEGAAPAPKKEVAPCSRPARGAGPPGSRTGLGWPASAHRSR